MNAEIKPSADDEARAAALFTKWGVEPSPATFADLTWALARVRGLERAKPVEKPPVRPGLYRHFKGNLYTVLFVAIYYGKHEGDIGGGNMEGFPEGTELVTYVGHYDNAHGNRIYVRPLAEFSELVEAPRSSHIVSGLKPLKVPRFVRVDEAR